MPEHNFVGIDWDSREHQLCIVDHNGKVLGERAFQHGGAGLTAMADWILSSTGTSVDDVRVAIEVPHGPVVESMMERGFAVYSINPKQLDRCRDRFSPAGAKDDRRDALTLADTLRTDRRFFRKLDAPTREVVELREWTRIASTLTAERTRLVNRLRQQLWRYFPQLLSVESDLTKLWVVELWAVARTPARARRLRLSTIENFLTRHRVRSVNAHQVQDRLREPAIHVAPGTTESVVSHIEILVDQMRLVAKQLATAYAAMDRLSASVAAELETPDHSDVECPSPHRDPRIPSWRRQGRPRDSPH